MKKVWVWLDGKKVTIGAALMLAWQGFNIVFPDVVGPETKQWVEDVLYLFTGAGLAHKGVKTLKKK